MHTAKLIILLLVGLAVVGGAAYAVNAMWGPGAAPGPVACSQVAMLCPDGSYVARTGPDCAFAPCPSTATTTPSGAPIVGPGAHCGGFINNAPVCQTGYHCQLKVSMPDTGGTCVADTPAPPSGSGVRGAVMLGPTCPVERNPPDPACADKPYSTLVAIYRASDHTHAVALLESDAAGSFQASLAPGDYLVAAGQSNLPRCTPVDFTVTANSYTTANISCDTGIR